MISVFFASAVLHELVFSVAFKAASPWFFGGMLMQMPLIQAEGTLKLRHTRRGNLLVWLSLFVGQVGDAAVHCASSLSLSLSLSLPPPRSRSRSLTLTPLCCVLRQPMLEMLYVVRYFESNDRFFCVGAGDVFYRN